MQRDYNHKSEQKHLNCICHKIFVENKFISNDDNNDFFLFDVFSTFQWFCFKVAGIQTHSSLALSDKLLCNHIL